MNRKIWKPLKQSFLLLLSAEFSPQISQKTQNGFNYPRNQRHLREPVIRDFAIDIIQDAPTTLKIKHPLI